MTNERMDLEDKIVHSASMIDLTGLIAFITIIIPTLMLAQSGGLPPNFMDVVSDMQHFATAMLSTLAVLLFVFGVMYMAVTVPLFVLAKLAGRE